MKVLKTFFRTTVFWIIVVVALIAYARTSGGATMAENIAGLVGVQGQAMPSEVTPQEDVILNRLQEMQDAVMMLQQDMQTLLDQAANELENAAEQVDEALSEQDANTTEQDSTDETTNATDETTDSTDENIADTESTQEQAAE